MHLVTEFIVPNQRSPQKDHEMPTNVETPLTESEFVALAELCKKFVVENGIGCPETIHQCDGVIVNAYDFIHRVCDIVGYVQYKDEIDEVED